MADRFWPCQRAWRVTYIVGRTVQYGRFEGRARPEAEAKVPGSKAIGRAGCGGCGLQAQGEREAPAAVETWDGLIVVLQVSAKFQPCFGFGRN